MSRLPTGTGPSGLRASKRSNLTTTLPAASRRDRLPTAVSPFLRRGSASPVHSHLSGRPHARPAARCRAAAPPAGVFACASASRSAARRGGVRPSIPRRSPVVHSKL
ncbi:hypothetical protein DF157_10005 [Burkholderia cenocepacia]|nr:hypothetical protein DF157_10005 [Burkholderia cenocepacia]RQV44925.1 hypothetical protein DF028_06185 [Burkholderia cenocepacia]RQV51473.1 hypothetical protein DF027_04010 [Burkholderia cenocepacia]RQV79477.1 hypothetical protein DF010_10480 [Burkholderia cenocepacia]